MRENKNKGKWFLIKSTLNAVNRKKGEKDNCLQLILSKAKYLKVFLVGTTDYYNSPLIINSLAIAKWFDHDMLGQD